MGSFWAQFCALCRKNWIVLWRNRWINILRCIILPIAYAAFFAKAQDFFTTSGVLGPGRITPLLPLPPTLLGHKFVWAPPLAASTNATISDFVDQLMARVLDGIDAEVVKTSYNNTLVERQCPQNFNLLSECFAVVMISGVDPANKVLNYTIRGDTGLVNIDVLNPNKDDVSQRYLPLQWAVESNFIEMTTGTAPPSPASWEYTNQSNQNLKESNRISYLNGIRSLIVLAHFLVFLGVVYQLPGSMASERASSLTSHLDAMGCRKSSRVISWHLSISAAYLPAWIIVAAIFHVFIYTRTNTGLFIVLYILTGLSLASWTHLVAVPFANSPTLAAIAATFIAIILAIIALILRSSTVIQLVLTLIFPPMFYTFFTKNLSAWETASLAPRLLRRSPKHDAPLLGLLLIAIIDIVLFPLLATWLEDKAYGVHDPQRLGFWRRTFGGAKRLDQEPLREGVAVKLEGLRKEYSTRRWGVLRRGKPIVAIQDLSFEVPTGEIFCLLGRNGAAKSTTLSIMARLINLSSGSVRYADHLHVGIASQKDVLWDELTCKQHIDLWRAVKTTPHHRQAESNTELLARCDLSHKVDYLAKNLSGGQKRKLQLACALAGGSNLLLLDEISSGLDPLSRRAIWKLIVENRGKTTIVLTTHFLDEADYLGDQVAILQAPGKLLALDNPVALKTQLGRGFTLSLDATSAVKPQELLATLRQDSPSITTRSVRGKQLFLTGSTDVVLLRRLVARLQTTSGHVGYQVNSATLEEVFLDLNAEDTPASSTSTVVLDDPTVPSPVGEPEEKSIEGVKDLPTYPPALPALVSSADGPLTLTPGFKPHPALSVFFDAYTIFLKRLIILRRAWLLPLIAIVMVICASCIPLFFMSDRVQTCAFETRERRLQHLTYPKSIYPVGFSPVVIAPQTAFGDLVLPTTYVTTLPTNDSFVDWFRANATQTDVASSNYSGLATFGGISLADQPTTQQSLFAWEASALLNKGPSALNLLSNAILDGVSPPVLTGGLNINATLNAAFRISLDFRYLASPSFLSTGQAMKWIGFFGLGVAVWPAFAVVYPTIERASNVRSNQYSNGATPAALWLGHLLHETPAILLVSSLIVILFSTLSSQFAAPGLLWLCFVLYGIASTLYAYIFALFLNSSLAAWAIVAGSNVILFLLYLASYLLVLTYDRSVNAPQHITLCHFTIGLVNPLPNILRAILVSINLFSLLCDGLGDYAIRYASLKQFGGPILYLVMQALLAFALLVYVDSGSPLPAFLRRRRKVKPALTATVGSEKGSEDVAEERSRVEQGEKATDELRVMGLTKRFRGGVGKAVDGVWFGVDGGETFALIGPNGAGKTTTLACIRGVEFPSAGDVMVGGKSIVKARNAARSYLCVCPQVNAIDPALTVRQHLWLYARLKGVPRRSIALDVDALLAASGLLPKADDLATSLSGGNQRKLSLGMALVGARPVVLIDEFSSGVDPFSKREAWATLASLTRDRAVVMTTHSMEEVDALASRVGIIASRMLAVGTPSTLKSRFATYELHMPAVDVDRALTYLHAKGFESAYRSMDTLTRVSVPGVRDGEDVGRLLEVVEGWDGDMTIHEASTETAFLEIVRAHNVKEEEGRVVKREAWWKRMTKRGSGA